MENHERTSRMEEFNCNTCDFQDNKRKGLKDHLEAAPGHKPCPKEYECRDCKKVFNSYYNLMNHTSVEHPTKKACRYFKEGKCNFLDEDCWYSHERTSSVKVTPDEEEDFQMGTKNLPPDMKVLINQIMKIALKKKN